MAFTGATRTGSLGLQSLNIEILLEVFGYLRPRQGLRPLSLSCKWIREACMPTLFETCTVNSYGVDKSENPTFLPCSLWPYVRILQFCRGFARPDLTRRTEDYFGPNQYDEWLREPARRIAAAQRLGRFVKDALTSMPSLHTVHFGIPESRDFLTIIHTPVGVAAHVLEAVLSVPHLRHLCMDGPLCHPEDDLLPEIVPPLTIALETFAYEVPPLRPHPGQRTSETDKLGVHLILERAHASLVSLSLPGESTSLHRMHLWEWPRLTKLRLYGELLARQGTPPLVTILEKMPRLRELSLVLAEPAGGKHRPIWPPSVKASYNWYDLEHLEVTHPHPEDEFYAHLPATLRYLSLRCWPRYYKHHTGFKEAMDHARVSWTSPLLSSSEMLHLLRSSETSNVTHLHLEFRADAAGDNEIFRHIGSSYPHLTVLEVHRYRSEGGPDPPVKQIANALRGLTNLRLLRAHLDFRCLPDVIDHWYPASEEERLRFERQTEVASEVMDSAAHVFAKTLAPSLEYISLLVPRQFGYHQWWAYRVVRTDGGLGTAEEYSPTTWPGEVYGYSIDSDE